MKYFTETGNKWDYVDGREQGTNCKYFLIQKTETNLVKLLRCWPTIYEVLCMYHFTSCLKQPWDSRSNPFTNKKTISTDEIYFPKSYRHQVDKQDFVPNSEPHVLSNPCLFIAFQSSSYNVATRIKCKTSLYEKKMCPQQLQVTRSGLVIRR